MVAQSAAADPTELPRPLTIIPANTELNMLGALARDKVARPKQVFIQPAVCCAAWHTAGCPKCEVIRCGRVRKVENHTAACRKRVADWMRVTIAFYSSFAWT